MTTTSRSIPARLIGFGGIALVLALSISAAKLAASTAKLPSVLVSAAAKVELQTPELLHDVTVGPKTPAVATIPHVRQIMMEVTAYCPCPKCCGPHAAGITASGKLITYNAGRFVAADTAQLPFGTKLIIPGYSTSSAPVEVIDRGGAIKGNKLDVFFPTHDQARQWGRRWVSVTVIE